MIKSRVLLFPVLLGLSCSAFAQVYKSTDAEGNVTFSDTPSADSEAVPVEATNVADPVKVPQNTPSASKPEVVKQQASPEVVVEIRDDDDGGNLRRGKLRRTERRHNRNGRGGR